MKLHTKLDYSQITNAMREVKQRGQVTEDVFFVQFDYENSRSHANGWKIQLGTFDKTTGPTKSRHYKNTGQWGADSDSRIWAATYNEWGWFIAEIFEMDPDATFGYYKGINDFHKKTGWKFE